MTLWLLPETATKWQISSSQAAATPHNCAIVAATVANN